MNRFSRTSYFILTALFSFLSPGIQAQWNQLGADIDGETNGDQSGYSVSLSADGNTVAIGALNNAGGGVNRGHVRVYKRTGGTWTQKGADIDGEADGDKSGFPISLSADGNTVAIGAIYNAGGGSNRGHVRVYKDIGGSWTQEGADIDGEADDDQSGYSVSLSADGNTVAIGAPNNAGGGVHRGYVRVYKNIGGSWIQEGADIDGEADDDFSGYSVSLAADGNMVAIGAPNNAGGGSNRGHVRVYKNIGGSWIQEGADIDGEANTDYSGLPVSLSADGTTVAIGAIYNAGGGSFRGHVRVYKNIGGSWTQEGADIDGEADDDLSGWSVSLSADGTMVAVGANSNAGGGVNRGHVRVYRNRGGTWTQQGADIDGEANSDVSGYSVSLSADGTTIAIGAPNNIFGIFRGHVRVYSYCSQNQQFLNAIISMAKQKGKKIYVCHQGIYNLQVSVPEFYLHLFHGDKLGKCEVNYCEGLEFRGNDLENFIGTEDDLSLEENMTLYPNPAGQILNVKLPFHTDRVIQIQVYNSIGQSMFNQPYYLSGKDQGALPVNIQKLPQGLYFLKASGEGYEASRPFTKF